MSVFPSRPGVHRRARDVPLLRSSPLRARRGTLTVLPGAGHEDPAFMRTQWQPTLAFLDRVFHM
jgi:hypothetical protein